MEKKKQRIFGAGLEDELIDAFRDLTKDGRKIKWHFRMAIINYLKSKKAIPDDFKEEN